MRPLGVEIAAMLADRGVTTVFGIPGVHNIEIYRGIEDAGLRHVLARNEMGAGFMADGYARASGNPGVCFVISGPGLTNAMTPIGQAYSDSVPLLVIASCLDETAAQKGQLHQMKDQGGAGRTVADWSETAQTPQAAFALIDRALQEMETTRARPKIIHVPIAVLGGPSPAFPKMPGTGTRLEASAEAVAAAADCIASAKCPLFIFGGGATGADVAELLSLSGGASFTTYAGRGLVPLGHPLHFGSFLARPGSAEVAAKADLIIAIGTELSETDLWRDTLGGTGPEIRVDIDPAILASTPNMMSIQADAGSFVSALTTALRPRKGQTDWSPDDITVARRRWRAEVGSDFPNLLPVIDRVKDAVNDVSDDVMVFSDMTQFAYAAKEVWDMHRPAHWHHPVGFGTLGYGLPAAIGGALGHDGPVMAIAGDSGLQYTLPELGTAAELGLSLPILLWDNDALKMIEDGMVAAQFAPTAVHQLNPDWKALAAAFRIGFLEPENLDSIAPALIHAFEAGRPTLIRLTPGLTSAV